MLLDIHVLGGELSGREPSHFKIGHLNWNTVSVLVELLLLVLLRETTSGVEVLVEVYGVT